MSHEYRYAKRLCESMAKNFYPENTGWSVCDDLIGVLTQIDNMVTGLERIPAPSGDSTAREWSASEIEDAPDGLYLKRDFGVWRMIGPKSAALRYNTGTTDTYYGPIPPVPNSSETNRAAGS